jgi:hypothetical protein
VLRRIFEPKRDEVMEVGENCIMRSFIACTLLQVYLECQKERDHYEDQNVGG